MHAHLPITCTCALKSRSTPVQYLGPACVRESVVSLALESSLKMEGSAWRTPCTHCLHAYASLHGLSALKRVNESNFIYTRRSPWWHGCGAWFGGCRKGARSSGIAGGGGGLHGDGPRWGGDLGAAGVDKPASHVHGTLPQISTSPVGVVRGIRCGFGGVFA